MKNYEDVDSWKTIMFLYNSALKEVGTKLEILNDEFQHVHKYNPIEHIKTRIKTPESIVKKLRRYGYEISIENMVKYINDIAGGLGYFLYEVHICHGVHLHNDASFASFCYLFVHHL